MGKVFIFSILLVYAEYLMGLGAILFGLSLGIGDRLGPHTADNLSDRLAIANDLDHSGGRLLRVALGTMD